MIFTQNLSLEERIVDVLLRKDPLNTKEIETILNTEGYPVTLQAIYRKLKKLQQDTVVSKKGLKYKIHNEWKNKLRQASQKYSAFYLPNEKERIIHQFKKFADLEIFFKDILYAVYEDNPHMTIFCHTHHYFWPYMEQRFKEQENFRKAHTEQRRYAFYNVSGGEPLDAHTRKKFTDDYYKITKNRLPSTKDNYHTAIIGPYIMSAIFDKKTAETVKKIYADKTGIKNQIQELQKLFNQAEPCKISVERNLAKAIKIKKQISKTFSIPSSVKEEILNEEEELKNQD